ncbi:MAG: GNAT family N-acetyltransferase [Chloroflexi bacterium]|nr:GNAT family N-acetyltransferase [Chloroflexota bacterium]
MNKILHDLTPSALVKAIEANRIAFTANLGRVPRTEFHDDPEVAWYISGVPFPMFNSVARTQFTGEDADARIDEILRRFQSRSLPMCWWIGPMMRPTNLRELLQSRGFEFHGDAPGMAADLHALNHELLTPSGLTIERVCDAAMLKEWVAIVSQVFEFPECVGDLYFEMYARFGLSELQPWYNYIGLLDGKPVATASLLLAAGVAGIWAVATLPKARGQGIAVWITQPWIKGFQVSALGLLSFKNVTVEPH